MTCDIKTAEGPSLAERAERDPHRPRFHFVAPGGWLNDPNGLTHRDDVYHLFYQYNPHAPVHERIHWGHATSRDLVTWVDEPVALAPGAGPDRDGCWSGVLVDDHGVPTIIYSGRHDGRELPCLATGSPDLRTWQPHPGNPVIDAPPDGLDLTGFRDHRVWRENGVWRQLVGAGIRGAGGNALLYESRDLRSWRYVGPLLSGDAGQGRAGDVDWPGTMWECVDLFRVGRSGAPGSETDVLMFSAWDKGQTHHTLYWTGRYEGDTFAPGQLHRLDYGQRYFYAPQSFEDAGGRRIMFGWLQEGRSNEATIAAGWSGAMSLPRVVALGEDGQLVQAPAPEVAKLRHDHVEVAPFELGNEPVHLDGVTGDQLDLELRVRLDAGSAIQLSVRAKPDRREQTVIEVERSRRDAAAGVLRLHRSRSSLDPAVDTDPRSGPIRVADNGRVDLRVLVDHSALEIFANGRPLAARIYPTQLEAQGVSVLAPRGRVDVERIDAWQMAGIWDGTRPLWP